MSNYKFRVIKVENGHVDDYEVGVMKNNNPNLYVLQKRKLFGGWKRIYSSNYKSHVIEHFYKVSNAKRDEDEVIMGY